MRILLTGAAGFIGSAIDAQLIERGDEVVRVDAMIPEAHGPDAARRQGRAPARRTRRRAVGRPARRHRRRLPPGRDGRGRGDGGRPAVVRRAQRPRDCRAARRDARSRGRRARARELDGGVRRGPLRLRRARRTAATRSQPRCSRRRRLREPLPRLRIDTDLGSWCQRTRGSTRGAATPRASSRRSTTRWRGPGRRARRRSGCATTTSTVPACPATLPTPAWPRSSGRRWSAVRRRVSSRTHREVRSVGQAGVRVRR